MSDLGFKYIDVFPKSYKNCESLEVQLPLDNIFEEAK